jgi:hypothetical protein
VYFIVISLLSFHSENNLDQWYQSKLLLIIFQCMSPTRSEYIKLGLELVSLEDNHSCMPKKPSMEAEKKNDEAEDSINMLLEQALVQQREEMMENFSHIHYCIWVKFRRRVRRNCHFLLSEDRQTSDPLKRRFT